MCNNSTYIIRMCLAIALCSLSSGCIVVPVNFHAYGSRHNVNEEVISALQPDTTTREYVLLTFGEPDYVSDDKNCFTYTWEKVKLLLLVGGGGAAHAGAIDCEYDLFLCFDGRGLLVRKELKKKSIPKTLF